MDKNNMYCNGDLFLTELQLT